MDEEVEAATTNVVPVRYALALALYNYLKKKNVSLEKKILNWK